MHSCPGVSWGFDAHVNLEQDDTDTEKYRAVYYDHPGSAFEIIREWTITNEFDRAAMMKIMTFYNYNTCALCPMVRAEIDWTC
jgi:hypothetical protein